MFTPSSHQQGGPSPPPPPPTTAAPSTTIGSGVGHSSTATPFTTTTSAPSVSVTNNTSSSGAGGNADFDLVGRWRTRLAAFEELAQKWRGVGLGALQRTRLAADALTISANKEALTLGRRRVGALTKTFAGLANEEKLSDFPNLLRAYQGYVDEVTRFLGDAERAYVGLHDAVLGMVDPFPLLERFARERATILEFVRAYEEGGSLRSALRERESELAQLSNQEVTIKKLRVQLAEAELAASASVQAATTTSQEEIRGMLVQWKQREGALHDELRATVAELRRAEGELQEISSQLVTSRHRCYALEAERDADAASAYAELDATQAKLITMEQQRAQQAQQMQSLQQQLAQLKAASATAAATATNSAGGDTTEEESKGAARLSSAHDAAGPTTNVIAAVVATTVDVDDDAEVQAMLEVHRAESTALRERCTRLEQALEAAQQGEAQLATLVREFETHNKNNNNNKNNKTSSASASSSLASVGAVAGVFEEVARLREAEHTSTRLCESLRARLDAAEEKATCLASEREALQRQGRRAAEDHAALAEHVRTLERELRAAHQQVAQLQQTGLTLRQERLAVGTSGAATTAAPSASTSHKALEDGDVYKDTNNRTTQQPPLLQLEAESSFTLVTPSTSATTTAPVPPQASQQPAQQQQQQQQQQQEQQQSQQSQQQDAAFFAVVSQRDRLRQRLLALEEATSKEVETLRQQLRAALMERDELLHATNTATASNNTMTTGGVPSSLEDGSTAAINMMTQQQHSLSQPTMRGGGGGAGGGGGIGIGVLGGGTSHRRAAKVVSALDSMTVLLYRHVLSDALLRRAFLAYLAALHIFVFADLFYQTSGWF